MPIYLYKCKKCGKEFEYSQRITDEALTKCPIEICEAQEKGAGEVERKISKNIGLIFNGKGFYSTDYTNKNASFANGSNKNNGHSSEAPKCNCPASNTCPAANNS